MKIKQRFKSAAGCTAPAWVAVVGMSLAGGVNAASFDLGDSLRGHTSLSVNYAAAMRAQSQSSRLIDGPIDPGTGLPTTANSDDGNRNFDSGGLVNNRITTLAELFISGGNYGVVVRGDAFYDNVYRRSNDNDSPATINKTGPNNEFTDEARRYNGARARLLDAYAYADWRIGEAGLNIRAGRQVVAWGESLFFSGVASAQGPADATKANVPGAELKSILLPVEQVSAQLSLGHGVSLLGYYQLRFKETELEPVGSYFSTTDIVGPGAQFLRLAAGDINLPRGPDDEPSDNGQWGLGMRYQLTGATNIGLYWLRYHNASPQVRLDFVNNQYNVFYADGIQMTALSFSSRLGPANIAGEVSYRDRMDLLVDGPMGPTATRGGMSQVLISALYTMTPNPISRQIDLVGEIGAVRVHSVDALEDGSDGLTADRSSWAYSGMATFNYPNVFPRWDMAIPVTVSGIEGGTPAMAGAFGGNFGRADRRASIGANFVYLQRLEVGVSYNAFFGSPDLVDRPLVDRDYAAVNLKYTF
jgi:hypothetical protein